MLKIYVSRLADWLQILRTIFVRDSVTALRIRHFFKIIIINLLIIIVIIGVGTFLLYHIENLPILEDVRDDYIGLGIGFIILILCIPSSVVIWRSLRGLADEAVIYVLGLLPSNWGWRYEALRIVFRDSIIIAMTLFMAIWFVPFISVLLDLGSYALLIPVILLALVLYIVLNSGRHIHHQLEQNFSQILLGEHYTSTAEKAKLLGISESKLADLMNKMKLKVIKKGSRNKINDDKGEKKEE